MADGVAKRVRSAVVIIRVLPEWKQWAEGLAEHDGAASMAELVDRAMVAYGQRVKFDKRAPRR